MRIFKNFGEKLKYYRTEIKHFSSCELLARDINKFYGKAIKKIDKKPPWIINPQNLRFYEKGERLPRDQKDYKRLADYFGVSERFLMLDYVQNPDEKNEEIGERTGLSDRAIEIIENYNCHSRNIENQNRAIIEEHHLINQVFENPYFEKQLYYLELVRDLTDLNNIIKIDHFEEQKIEKNTKKNNQERKAILMKFNNMFYSLLRKYVDIYKSEEDKTPFSVLLNLSYVKEGETIDHIVFNGRMLDIIRLIDITIESVHSKLKDNYVHFLEEFENTLPLKI